MKKAVVVLVLVLAASLAAASLSGTVDACAGVPSMPIDAACQAASTGPAMYSLCVSILQSSSPASGGDDDLATYAVGAAGAAALSSDAATAALGDGSLPGALRDACVADYGNARQAISGVADQLVRCEFADDNNNLRQGFMDALSAVEDCAAKLDVAGGASTPVYGMVVGNRDRIVIAFRLASSLMTD